MKLYGTWFGILFAIFLVNLPFLSPQLVFVHDTLQQLFEFHYFYSELYFQNELPNWSPFIGYGIPTDLNLLAFKPTDYVVMVVGWLLGVEDTLLLFKASCLLTQAVFVLGLFLLAMKMFANSTTIWLVCLGAILTNSWLFNYWYNLSLFYLLPMFYYFLLAFLECGKVRYLCLAGIVELLSIGGPVIYVAPLHLLVFLAFLLPYVVHQPRLILSFLNVRGICCPFLLVFVCLAAALSVWIGGRSTELVAPDRDPHTGHVTLQGFLTTYRTPLASRLSALVFGHVAHGDKTLFVGVLPLLLVIYGLLRRRDMLFLAFVVASFALVWFGIGGWFSTACYYLIPGMKTFRNLDIAFNLLKFFLLILGGFGCDTLLQDVKKKSLCGSKLISGVADASMVLSRWSTALLLAFGLVFVFDLSVTSRPEDLVLCRLDKSVAPEEDNFAMTPYARPFFVARCLLPAALLAACHVCLWLPGGRVGILFGLVHYLLPTVYLIDVGSYYCQIIWGAPYCSEDTDTRTAFRAGPLEWSDERFIPGLRPFPPTTAVRIKVLVEKRGGVFLSSYYATQYQFVLLDPVEPRLRLDHIMPGIKKMIECRGGAVTSAGFKPIFKLPEDASFRRSLGAQGPKISLLHRARYVDSETEATRFFTEIKDPDKTLVVVAPKGTFPDHDESDAGTVSVTFFAANRLVIKIDGGTPGWLFYADAFHPGWKATVNGREAPILLANVGCKAVRLEAGDSEVVFFFDAGPRGWIRMFLILTNFCAGVVLTSLLFTPGVVGPSLTTPGCLESSVQPAVSLRLLRLWTAASLSFLLACALWLY